MRAALLAGVLILFANVASGSDWQPFAAAKAVDATVYIDRQSVGPRGSYRKAWTLWDYSVDQVTKHIPPRTYRSEKVLSVFDCAEKTVAVLQSIASAENLGAGAIVNTFSLDLKVATLEDISPDSINEALYEFVCKSASAGNRKTK